MSLKDFDYSSSDSEDIPEPPKLEPTKTINKPKNISKSSTSTNINKVLVLLKRGISPVIRHFLHDFNQLLQNPIKAPKFKGKDYVMLNELADEKNCNVILLFETRHSTEHYLWFALTPGGPSMCFFVENIHSIEELHFIGKCTPRTRPLLFFDPRFNSTPALQIAKEILKQTFGPPFVGEQTIVDTAISFFYEDGHIWVVRYQIMFDQDPPALFEAGPRFCLQPVLILGGSFCGKEIYKNKDFTPPHKRKFLMPEKVPSKLPQKEEENDQEQEKKKKK
ncbi:Ribosome biogenesis protein BRX1 [Tritrichomonas foetus]|uniref:Ribosome biogenesis protein BRX1 n=1 Tax=Tritrichomonas foetus TaxID=1144522 RepID=A0A1J4KVW3_9EUKA|nr:Ribosome biogenesis protein BRX1 [Tritrichomonas foetus]|eukprot:OHT15371.1 Ribosome biogenesis protein BRX1 [Tritrichomonas foetus]